MKTFLVRYQHGQFIDINTKKRVIPIQGEDYTISGNDNAFNSSDDRVTTDLPLDKATKAKWVEKFYGKENYLPILEAGTQLFFRIGNSKVVIGDENQQYIFLCTLLEDLYLWRIRDKDGKNPTDWRLVDCKCVLDKCLLGNLSLSEKIQADSLSKLFSSTVMFYFNMQRSGSTNAFSSFYIYHEGMNVTYEGAKHNWHPNLDRLRTEAVNKHIKS